VKAIITFLLLAIILLLFFTGIFVGHYQIFPFQVLQEFNKLITPPISPEIHDSSVDILSLVHIENMENVSNLRSELINYIWSDKEYPLATYPQVISNISDSRYDDLSNLQRIDKIKHVMEFDVNSIGYHFIPKESNNKLIIYHQGHGGDFFIGKNTIEFFLEHGYSVLAFTMPLVGMNDTPDYNDPNLGTITLQLHSDFSLLESSNFNPIKLFFEPLVLSLNYIDLEYNYQNYYMVGISGGGWTAVIFPAIDSRIKETYSIAGSVPFIFRNLDKNYGDYEQRLVEMYQITNYFDLYLMAGSGEDRKFVQIFNKFDPCCFSGDYQIYEDDLKKIMQNFEGEFDMIIDDTHKEHKISNFTLEYIKNSIEQN